MLEIPTAGTPQCEAVGMGSETMKVQVVVCIAVDGITLCLEDVEGIFFDV